MNRVFTLEEVDDLIPELNRRVGELLVLREHIDRELEQLTELLGEAPRNLNPEPADTPAVRTLKRSLGELVPRYEGGWADIEGLGAVVKDTQIGLLDFYGRVDGRLVWLCWRYGEESLGYYHELNSGYAGRRALGQRQRQLLVN